MHPSRTIGVFAAVIALTAAAPHARNHYHLHGRSVKSAPIVTRSILDGACGGDSGDACQPGYCCSQWGYCGKSKDYCGTGCNSAFGECGTNSSSSAAESVHSTTSASTVTLQSTISISAIPSSTFISSSLVESDVSSTEPTNTAHPTSRAGSSSTESISVAEATKYYPRPTWSAPAYSPPESSSALDMSVSATDISSSAAPTPNAGWTTTFATVVSSSSAAPLTTYASAPSSSSAPESSSKTQPTSTWALTSSSSVAAAPTSYALGTSSYSSATPSATSSYGSGSGSNTYEMLTGDGTTSAGWPAQDAWVDFESMWSANMKLISASCTEFGQDNNSDEESDNLKSAIQSVASSSNIDARFILAVVMQESKGCVRAPTTNYGVRNPGLMQDHDGAGTCNDASVSNPCPQSEIEQMIKDGTTGTAAGDGLEQCISESGASDVSKYYKAARIYNSGSVTGNDLSLGVATHCYSSDIANRLTGWVDAPTACTL